MKIYCYRYMWLLEDKEELQVKILVGSSEEHLQFINSLQEASGVKNACRVYQYEIEVQKIEDYETIVSNENKQEVGEENED